MFKPEVIFDKVERPALSDLKTLLSAYKAENDFSAALMEYKSRPALLRLMRRGPEDPYPGVGQFKLERELQDSLKQMYPSLDMVFNDGDIKGRTIPEFSLNKDGSVVLRFGLEISDDGTGERNSGVDYLEKYTFTPDKGFVLTERYRSPGGLSEPVMRPKGGVFDTIYEQLDSFLASAPLKDTLKAYAEGELPVRSEGEVRESLKRLDRLSLERAQLENSLRSEVHHEQVLMKVNSLRDYCQLFFDIKDARQRSKFVAKDDYYGRYLYSCADAAERRLNNFNNLVLFDYANENAVQKRMSLRELFERAQLNYPDKLQRNDMLEDFLRTGLQSGYHIDEMSKFIEIFSPSKEGFRTSYEFVHFKVANQYVRYVREQLETAWGEGVRDVSKVEVSSPYGQLEYSFSEAHDKKKVNIQAESVFTSTSKGNEKGTVVSTQTALLPAGTVYTVFPEDLNRNIVPPGVDINVTFDGKKYISTFNQNNMVPDDGLFLVKKDNCTNMYNVCTKKQFELLYNMGEDGLAHRREVKQNLKPGIRKKNTLNK